MSYACSILADSISPSGVRLTTFEVTFPRIVLAEYNTHRKFSRNSASSRAIPVEKMLAKAMEDPFIPVYWGKNQKGMQADKELTAEEIEQATRVWLEARDSALLHAKNLLEIGVHKQITNRLLEPWLWQTCIVTATEYQNFFSLRTHRDAQPEIRKIAVMMQELYNSTTPKQLAAGEWHLPLVPDFAQLVQGGFTIEQIIRICIGRCARVSYLTHQNERDPQADLELCNRLQTSGHMSPFEHVARALADRDQSGNLEGWQQYRKTLPGEAIFTV